MENENKIDNELDELIERSNNNNVFETPTEDDNFDNNTEEMIVIDGNEYRRSDVEDVLRDYAYDFYDLDNDLIDEEDWEDILEDLRFK